MDALSGVFGSAPAKSSQVPLMPTGSAPTPTTTLAKPAPPVVKVTPHAVSQASGWLSFFRSDWFLMGAFIVGALVMFYCLYQVYQAKAEAEAARKKVAAIEKKMPQFVTQRIEAALSQVEEYMQQNIVPHLTNPQAQPQAQTQTQAQAPTARPSRVAAPAEDPKEHTNTVNSGITSPRPTEASISMDGGPNLPQVGAKMPPRRAIPKPKVKPSAPPTITPEELPFPPAKSVSQEKSEERVSPEASPAPSEENGDEDEKEVDALEEMVDEIASGSSTTEVASPPRRSPRLRQQRVRKEDN